MVIPNTYCFFLLLENLVCWGSVAGQHIRLVNLEKSDRSSFTERINVSIYIIGIPAFMMNICVCVGRGGSH